MITMVLIPDYGHAHLTQRGLALVVLLIENAQLEQHVFSLPASALPALSNVLASVIVCGALWLWRMVLCSATCAVMDDHQCSSHS